MLRGFYTIASGILQQERTIGVLSNNLVNANTPGFKASRVVSTTFEHEYITRIEKNNTRHIGAAAPIRVVSDVPTRFDASSLEETGYPYHMALSGDGFFMVEAPEGARYLTRNGSFDLDDAGYLVLPGAGRVLSDSGQPILLGHADFYVGAGGLLINSSTGEDIARLRVAQTGTETALTLTRNGLYATDNPDGLPQFAEGKVIQGYTERSNIDLTQEYTRVMEAQRAFQACSTALQIIDRINQKAATEIASL
jgi:flagellar basal-body rod protein FlgF